MNLNKVQIAGRLTRDPEVRFTTSGTAISDISLAVSRFWKNDKGESQEETDFINVTAFGRSAEIIEKHLHKGSPIFVKQTGAKRSKLKVIAKSMQFVGPKRTDAFGCACKNSAHVRHRPHPPQHVAQLRQKIPIWTLSRGTSPSDQLLNKAPWANRANDRLRAKPNTRCDECRIYRSIYLRSRGYPSSFYRVSKPCNKPQPARLV